MFTRYNGPHLPLLTRLARKASGAIDDRVARLAVGRYLRAAGVPDAPRIHSFTTREELTALMYLAMQCPPGANVLEIGSYVGASTCYLAAGLLPKGGKIFCVDTWQNETMPEGTRDTMRQFQENTRGVAGMLCPVRKRSDELRAGDVGTPVALAFIDGDHSYEAAAKDFATISPWMSDKGICAFHDSRCYEGVSRLVGEVLATGEWQIAGNVDNLVWLRRAVWEHRCAAPPSRPERMVANGALASRGPAEA